jgi:IS1 family transposase
MNRLPLEKRVQILTLLCEGNSMRSVSRIVDVSINTVTRELILAGRACAAFHDEKVRNVTAKRIQCDEIWSFTYAKHDNVKKAKAAPEGAGDIWTWTAIDADTKLIVSWLVGGRGAEYAMELMNGLHDRLRTRVQLTTDGHRAYLEAVESAFGPWIDYAMLIKIYGGGGVSANASHRYSPGECIDATPTPIRGEPEPDHISTSFVERSNLTMRTFMRRFTRLTLGFSKKVEHHAYVVALYTVWHNFIKMHRILKMTPAMAAGVSDRLYDISDLVAIMDAAAPGLTKRGPYKKKAA